MAKVAFLGLGVMGFPMAGHLGEKGGHEVTVYNRHRRQGQGMGGQVRRHSTAPTPKAAAEGQDFVMCCVGNDNDLRAVTIGDNGAFAGMKKGATFVDHTTASAEVAARARSPPPPRPASSSSTRPCPAARPVRKTGC